MRIIAADQRGTVLYGFSGTPEKYCPYGYNNASGFLGFNGQCKERYIVGYLLGNGQRFYSPSQMRFTSPDSLSPFSEGGINSYVYAGNDPLNSIDPTGHVKVIADLLKVARKAAGPTDSLLKKVANKAIGRKLMEKPLYSRILMHNAMGRDARALEKALQAPLLSNIEGFAKGFQGSRAPELFWSHVRQRNRPISSAIGEAFREFSAGRLPYLKPGTDSASIGLFKLYTLELLEKTNPLVANIPLPALTREQEYAHMLLERKARGSQALVIPLFKR
ncbi:MULTISPECIES: RHS repeat-associated core domain-containing protein [Pseudomonas]|uniref:RHS repeat-associated core domain-containing protein n=1 Tax=Pseudomonas quercus TaxID=2722792 RepID=A0ABX0YDR0_9PSED|nr:MULTISPECIES: RHS repeat-associated core domain-containing protein [Pseudomonas]MBF7142995.1 RHS repeat-associated core domain-containing protein [Pseudomonas sp. LY10J]NJP01543.1 RHS repeat-associated core domain-containing protein [Pseudomonas quercus]